MDAVRTGPIGWAGGESGTAVTDWTIPLFRYWPDSAWFVAELIRTHPPGTPVYAHDWLPVEPVDWTGHPLVGGVELRGRRHDAVRQALEWRVW